MGSDKEKLRKPLNFEKVSFNSCLDIFFGIYLINNVFIFGSKPKNGDDEISMLSLKKTSWCTD